MTGDFSPAYRQLPLGFRVVDETRLSSFYTGDNQAVIEYMKNLKPAGDQTTFIWGAQGVGLSFLLQAQANAHNGIYIPLRNIQEFQPDFLAGLDEFNLVCIDDIENCKGRIKWQQALFHLYNRLRARDHQVIIAGHQPPAGLKLELSDLQSRMQWGPVFQVKGLTDHQKELALKERAALRGLELDSEVISYLMSRYSRDIQFQFRLLDKLDAASMTLKRKITIPFVKEVAGQYQSG